MRRDLPPLPIDADAERIVAALRRAAALVLLAPTGAGKTTRLPSLLLDRVLANDDGARGPRGGQVVLLEPRRIAAKAAAARIAWEREAELGGEVGYQVRFERRASRATRILAVTEGLFLRMLHDDPLLEGVAAVVFDEFHERSLDADLALAMVRKVQAEVRPDLKIIVMSATLAPTAVAKFLGDCEIIEMRGRGFPVDIRYSAHTAKRPIDEAAAEGVLTIADETAGDVLAFLPGVGEIRRTAERLRDAAERGGWALLELYGDLPLDAQQAVLRPLERRKVILATNVAESSLTIDGVTAVVDTGLAKVLRHDPALGLNRLQTDRISRASADQRAGRAGRTAPGVCLRLWTQREQHGLAEAELPEIARVDLAGALLQLLAWGERDVEAFSWFEQPPAQAVEQARRLLQALGATTAASEITPLGQAMAALPVHPRVARLLLAGQRLGNPRQAALAAALLTERDPFVRGAPQQEAEHRTDSDVLDRVQALEEFERHKRTSSIVGQVNAGAAKGVLRVRDQLLRLLREGVGATADDEKKAAAGALRGLTPPARQGDADEALLRALSAGFADRLARRRARDSRRGVMVGGRGVELARGCAVREAELFVCVEVDDTGRSDSLVRQASAVELDWLDADKLTARVDLEFDAQRQRVMAVRRTLYDDLVLSETPAAIDDADAAGELLAREAAARWGDSFRLDEEAEALLARIACLREWMPQLELPDLGENPLAALLPRLCAGCTSLAEVRKRPITPAVQSLLTPVQWQALAQHAPERIAAPSGSQIRLTYERGKPPVLAVRIQEIFGLRATPRVAAGRVPVLMHLLGPNMRPQQITGDLESFWANAYPQIRKDLRRRYPKHSWPEDPLQALPRKKPGGK